MSLAVKHGADYDELEKWYDGYYIGDITSMFNPNSVYSLVTCCMQHMKEMQML